jgi:hypothetical protein
MSLNPENKTPKKFNCEKCNFNCSKECDWNRHINTSKHLNRINRITKPPKTPKKYVCECDKEYKYSRGLWEHKKKCSFIQEENQSNTDKKSSTDTDKELLIKLLLKNPNIIEKLIELI